MSDKNEYTKIEDIYKVHAQPFNQDFFKQIALFENPKIQIDVKQLFLKLKDAKIYSNRLGIKRFLDETPNKDSIYAIQVVSDKEIIVVARMYNGGYGLSNNGCNIQEFSGIRIDIEEFKENKNICSVMVNSSDYWNKDYELYDSNSKDNQEAMLYKNGHAYFASIVGVKNIKQVIEISADNIENLYLLAEGTYIIVVKQ